MMLRPLFVLPVALAALLFGCADSSPGADTPTPGSTPTETPTIPTGDPGTPAPVPGLFVVDESGNGAGAVAGTRCWGGGCVDYIGPLTNAQPVTFAAGDQLQWQAEGGTIESLAHGWTPAGAGSSEPTSDGRLVWRLDDGPDFSEGDIAVPSEPGDYVLQLFARYTNGGDVLFGLYVTVE